MNEMNAATFRAIRETIGMSQRTVAEGLEVTEQAVRYWERGLRPVPNSVADWIEQQLDYHNVAVEETLAATHELINDSGCEIDLSYFRTQEEYDEYGRDKGDFGIVNARARAIAERLRPKGYDVIFQYPD